MEDAKERLQLLIRETLQILDHMVVDSEYNETLEYIKGGLRKAAHSSEDDYKGASDTLTIKLKEINHKVQQLETCLLEDYKKSTGNQIEHYEELSIDEQREKTEAYHDKIDYLSAVKIKENINEMTEHIN